MASHAMYFSIPFLYSFLRLNVSIRTIVYILINIIRSFRISKIEMEKLLFSPLISVLFII